MIKKIIRQLGHQLSYCIAVVDLGLIGWLLGLITFEQWIFMSVPLIVFILIRPTLIRWEKEFPPEKTN